MTQTHYNILDYILQQTGAKPKRQGNKVLINPCPICGHRDHFFIYPETNSYCSFSRCCRGGTLVDWMIEYEGLSLAEAMRRVYGDEPPPGRKIENGEIKKLASLLNEKVEGFFDSIVRKYKAFVKAEESCKKLNFPLQNAYYRWIRYGVRFYDRLTDEFISGDFEKRVQLMRDYENAYFFKLSPKGVGALEP